MIIIIIKFYNKKNKIKLYVGCYYVGERCDMNFYYKFDDYYKVNLLDL